MANMYIFQKLTATRVALAAVSTSLVCLATMVFSISVPATRGFFNIGETMIYTTALLLGPVIGAFAGGVGSGLADVLLGFGYYAPATLLIKACEGGIVGFLGRRRPRFQSKLSWRAFTFALGCCIGLMLGIVGSIYYVGTAELSIGLPFLQTFNATLFVPPELWYFFGVCTALLISLAGFVLEPEFGWLVFTTLIGGTLMIAGYYLYQSFLLFPLFGIEILAIAEIPINTGQMLVGLVVALPIVRILIRSFPQLKSQKNSKTS